MSSLRSRKTAKRTEIVLRPVRPNLGIEIHYRKRLDALIEDMHASVMWFLRAAYRKQEPRIAQDETPADSLRRSIRNLSKRWNSKFDDMAGKLAEHFAQSVEKRSSGALKKILKDGGWSVDFHMTPAMKDIVDATVHANVALIKSIPAQYMEQVEGIVMRGVQTGRDLGQVSQDLQKRLGVTKRRAAFIARDQSNKCTAAFNRARQLELGLTHAIWVHSGHERSPRPSHLKASREKQVYDIRKGWFDPDVGEYILPGTLPNCRCVGKPIVKGFS